MSEKEWFQKFMDPSNDEQINKMWYIYTMEYYMATKRNEVQTHATTQMNPEHMLSEKSPAQKTTYSMRAFI